MRARPLRFLALGALVCVLAVLVACVTAEVKSARAALEAARAAGKANQCPTEFAAAEDLVRRAELLCNQCKPGEANALAADAMSNLAILCQGRDSGRDRDLCSRDHARPAATIPELVSGADRVPDRVR